MMFLTLFALSSSLTKKCVADSQEKCPSDASFISTDKFKATDIEGTPESKSKIELYLYADISSVTINLSSVNTLIVHSNSTEQTPKGKISLEFPSNEPDCTVSLNNVEVNSQSNVIKAKKLLLSNVELIGSGHSIYVLNLTTDIRSLLNVNDIQAQDLSLTKLEKVSKNIIINIIQTPNDYGNNNIYVDGNADFEFHMVKNGFYIIFEGIRIFSINSILAKSVVKVENLKKNVRVIRDEWLLNLEIFDLYFCLDGGTIVFPPDEWPQYHETLTQAIKRMMIEIISQSKIEIGCLNLPIDIESNNDDLEIVVTSKKCGISGYINSDAEISIRTDLNEEVQFTVGSIVSDSFINGDNKVELIINTQSHLDFLYNNTRVYFEEFNVRFYAIESDDFRLTRGGSIVIELTEDNDRIESGNLTVKGKMPEATEGKKFKIVVNIDNLMPQYMSHKSFKGLMSDPITLLRSTNEFKQSDWDLDVTGTLPPFGQNSKENIESFKKVAELNYDKVGDMFCLQLKLNGIPDIASEKYCVGDPNYCSHTSENINISQLKDHVDQGTKTVEIEINQDIDEPIDLSGIQASANYSFYSSNSKYMLNLDIRSSDNVNGIKTENIILKSNFNDIQGDNVKFSIPYLALKDTRLKGAWLDKTFDFTGSYVEIDANNFEELSKSKFKDLNLLINKNTTSLTIKNDGWIAGTLNKTIIIPKSQVTGSIGLKFDEDGTSSDPFLIDVDPSMNSVDGLNIMAHSSTTSMTVSLNLTDNWNSLQSVGSGIKISFNCYVILTGVTNKQEISLEGDGQLSISLKDDNATLNVVNPTKIFGNTNIIIQNGDAVFSELIFGSSSIIFEFSSNRPNGPKFLSNPIVQPIITDKMELYQDSLVQSYSGFSVNDKLIMNPKSVLIFDANDNIEFGANEIVINYLLDGFPTIAAQNISKVPQKLVFNYVGDDVIIESNIIGIAYIILSGSNDTFSEFQCNKLAQTATFNSQFVDLDGESSVIKMFCSATTISNSFTQVLFANITSIPSNKKNPGKPDTKKSNVGLIVGCTIAAVVVVAVIAYFVVRIYKKKKNDQKKSSSD